jgi:hypothetical protein
MSRPNPMTEAERVAEGLADRLHWLEANAARCERLHPKAECHKLYRRNAKAVRAHLEKSDG